MTTRAFSVSITPNMSASKPRQVRVYLNEEASDLLKTAASQVSDISESQLTSILVLSGLRALKDCGFKMALPFRLHVDDSAEIPARILPSARR